MKRMVESEIADILNEKLQVDENGIELKDSLHVDGKISGGEIVEDMEGYSFTKATPSNVTLTYLYAGAVKNGNKLTLCVAAQVAPNAEISSGAPIALGAFKLPSDISAKIVPFTSQTLTNVVDIKAGTLNSYVTLRVNVNNVIYKDPGDTFNFRVYPQSNVAAGATYFIRFEATFLLSDNLAA